ncbi:YdcH family protein [Paracoccus pacificus]|uniref:YdcH family protein n=1 Tax=Paracoccus pacificus TaxID=1463598 RepID=A0ABW4R1S9_9RHOB
MSVASHVEELRRKHENLSSAVEREQRNPNCDDFQLAQMKREKLRLKEEIGRLSS